MGIFEKFKKSFNENKLENKLQEAPLGYWEEKSYMMAIPGEEDGTWSIPSEIVKKISAIPNVTVIENRIDEEKSVLYIKLEYDNEEYEVGIFPGPFSLPEMYISPSFNFKNEELEKLKNAKSALTIFMEFKKNCKKSFHLQLKIATATVPHLIGLVDESAERLLPAKWAILAANSSVTPGPSDIFNVQAIYDEKSSEEVWLHTHGLCRCGLTELEILKSNKENYRNHYNLINTFASFIIDKNGELNPREQSICLGILVNRQPIVAICKSWTEALNEYDNLNLGGLIDRKDAHNTRTSPIFLYTSKEDEDNHRLSKVEVFDKLWGENPMFFFSDEETARMKALAMERFDYVKNAIKNEENQVIVKIGLKCDDGKDTEHIWFEIMEFDGEKFKAKLTQEPYNVSNIHEGDERWFTVQNVTDWIIYTPNFAVDPAKVYLL